jgi:bacterioferritin-associated ferredoxin
MKNRIRVERAELGLTQEQVAETEAGTVCGQCQDDIQEILVEINGK